MERTFYLRGRDFLVSDVSSCLFLNLIKMQVPLNPYSLLISFSRYRGYEKCRSLGFLKKRRNLGGAISTWLPNMNLGFLIFVLAGRCF